MKNIARLALGLLFVASTGCAPADDASLGTDTDSQDVVNGFTADTAMVQRYGLASVFWGGLGCSAVVYRNNWVLTAAHCFNFTTPTSGITVQFNGQNFSGNRVRRVSTADLALVRLTTPVTMNGSTTGYQVPIYQGTLPALQGRNLYCFGAGTYGFAPSGGALVDWRQRVAILTVSSYTLSGPFYGFEPNVFGQILGGGDSGGACFLVENGTASLTGITRNAGRVCANAQPGQGCGDGNATGIAWSDQTYVNSYRATMNSLSGGPLPLPTFP